MRNLLISALLVGALACPVAYATEEAAPAQGPEQQQAEQAKDANAAPEHKKAKKHKKHKKAKKHAKKHKSKKHHAHDQQVQSQSDEAATHSSETPAEKKIDQETELNNR